MERCAVHRDANAITATDERGVIHIPAASLGALLLGPGTTVTQQAMVLAAESGSTVVWVGEVGSVSKRVRELLWERTTGMVRTGRAIMVFSARNEQGLSVLVHGHHWQPVDIDGITLMLRPSGTPSKSHQNSDSPSLPTTGWSKAARRRRA